MIKYSQEIGDGQAQVPQPLILNGMGLNRITLQVKMLPF